MTEAKQRFARISYFIHGARQVVEVASEHFVIGRGSQTEVRIEAPGISRRHVEVEIRNGKIQIKDLGSLNGSFVGSKRMTANEWFSYEVGVDLKIGIPPLPVVIEWIDESKTVAASQIKSEKSLIVESQVRDQKTGTGASVLGRPPAPQISRVESPSSLMRLVPKAADEGSKISNLPGSAEVKSLELQLEHLKGEVARHSRINKQLQDLKTEVDKDLEKARSEFSQIQEDYQKFLGEHGQTKQNLENQIKSLQDECDGLGLARDQIKQQKEKAEVELKQKESEVENLKAKIANLENEFGVLSERVKLAESNRDKALEAERQGLESLREWETKQKVSEERVQNLNLQFDEKSKDLTILEKNEVEATQRISLLKEEARRLQSELEDLKVADRKRKAEIEALEAENKLKVLKIEAENERVLTQKKVLERESSEVESNLRDLKLQLLQNEKKLSETSEAEKSTHKVLEEKTKILKSIEQNIARLEIELSTLQIQNTELENRRINQAKENEAQRSAFETEISKKRQEFESALTAQKDQFDVETQRDREEILRRAQQEKERILKEAESAAMSSQQRLIEEQNAQRKRFELELSEMKFKASEEIRILREDEDRQIHHRRKREIGNLERSLEQIFRNGLPILKNENFTEESLSRFIGEIKRVARQGLGFESEPVPMDPQIQAFVPFNPEAKAKEKEFWRTLGIRSAIGLFLVVIVFFTPLLGFLKNSFLNYFRESSAASDIFVKRILEARANRPVFDPPQLRSYQNSYTDNMLYAEGYEILKTTPEIEKQWVLELNEFFKNEIEVGDRVVAEFVPLEGRMINDLKQLRSTIRSENSDEGIQKMRELEEQKAQVLIEMIGGPAKYFQFREFERLFYEKFSQKIDTP